MKRNYLNFYGNLMKSSDAYLVKLLDTLAKTGLLDNTLVIATADHGEMGTAHGGMRQKNFNVYEESTRVPLVYSNPRLFKKPRTNDALVSHVDFLPTLASLVGAPVGARDDWQGVDYSDQILSRSPRSRRRTTPSSPTTTTSPGRRAARTRSRRTTSSASASSATSSPATTTPTARSRTSGRCTTSSATRSSASTSPTRATSARPSSSASTSACARKLARVEQTRLQPLS